MTLAEDSHMNRPVTFDPNTTVGYYPWEDSTFGATRSYHLNSMAVASSNPFTQVMAPEVEARTEMVVESQADKDDTTEQRSREADMETEQVGTHTKRAEGDEVSADDDSKKNIALIVIGGFVAIGVAYLAVTSA